MGALTRQPARNGHAMTDGPGTMLDLAMEQFVTQVVSGTGIEL